MTAVEPEIDIIDALLDAAQLPPLVEETPIQEICRILDQLVKEYGEDYIYPFAGIEGTPGECRYVDFIDGDAVYAGWWLDETEEADLAVKNQVMMQPSCIVGHLAVRAGVELESLLEVNQEGVGAAWDYLPPRWRKTTSLEIALDNLQHNQDKGMPWGQAVRRFKEAVSASA